MSDDDLVKRLRAPDLNGRVGIRDTEAADAIERLTRERDDLDRAWIATNEELTKALARAEAAERKVEVLREALDFYANEEVYKPDWRVRADDLTFKARAALDETETKNVVD